MGKPRIVEVEWVDAAHLVGSAWTDLREASRETPVKVRTVGYVLRDGKDALVVASGLNGREASGVAVIPRRMVRRVARLASQVGEDS